MTDLMCLCLDDLKKYKKFFDEAPVGLYVTRQSDGLFYDLNPCGAKILGYNNPEEIISKLHSRDMYDLELRKQLIDRLKQNKNISDFEIKMNMPNGKEAWVAITASNGEGFIFGSIMDITEKKEMEIQIQNLQSQLSDELFLVEEQAKERLTKYAI